MIKKQPFITNASFNESYLLSSGRIGWKYALDLLNPNKKNKILLPSYIGINDKEGSGVFDSIRDKKIGYDFYDLNSDLSINISDFLTKIENPDIKGVLMIHYFGFNRNDMEQILRITKKYNVYLIEDCAHAFLSKNLGNFGDISFYSLHKFLPIHDGGILKINNNNLKVPPISSECNISEKSIRLLNRFDTDSICKIRRTNYNFLLKELKNNRNLQILYGELPDDITPMNFPILIQNRDKVYFELLRKQIETTSLYHTLIKEINKSIFPIPHHISNHILNLPIHQDINDVDLVYMVKTLRTIIGEC